jgi:hypothetical protein
MSARENPYTAKNQQLKNKENLLSNSKFLQEFVERIIGDINAGSVISAVVISTVIEYTGKVAYNAGRYNQLKMIEGK